MSFIPFINNAKYGPNYEIVNILIFEVKGFVIGKFNFTIIKADWFRVIQWNIYYVSMEKIAVYFISLVNKKNCGYRLLEFF